MMATRRDLSLDELAVIAELATAVPDLVTARDRLLAALAGGPVASGGATLKPGNWRELMEAVRLGVLTPEQARRFVNLPGASQGVFRRLARLRSQRGGAI